MNYLTSNRCARILQLTLDITKDDLVIEDQLGRMKYFNYRKKFQKIQKDYKNNSLRTVELVNLCCSRNGENFAKVLLQYYKNIKHVIIYRFKNVIGSDMKKVYCFKRFINKFSIIFYKNIIEGKTVQEAFNLARIVALAELSQKYYLDVRD